MKKFEFSLQKVMEVRQTEEKVLQRVLADARHKLLEAREDLEALLHKLDQHLERKGKMHSVTMNSARYMLLQNYIQLLEENIDISRKRIVELEKEENEAREKLLEKSKQKKAIEKLRDNRFDEYRREMKKEEQVFLDEITAQNGNQKAMWK
ncbi:MAG: flagellar export protein FliJ [Candidatus Cloacimonetes bacterium]|nr:flagellar export protein FliJ [Candidatus Cloacimonadota bacterium]